MIERVETGIAAFGSRDVTRTYTLHCAERCDHSIFLEGSAVPLPPVREEALSDNVHKQTILIEAWDKADPKKVSFDVIEPPDGSDVNVSQDVPIIVQAVIHNNGPVSADVQDEILAFAPAGCTVLPDSCTVVVSDLAPSVDVVIQCQFDAHCTEPSTHVFTFTDEVTLLGPTHVYDTDLANNTAGPISLALNVWDYADVKILSQQFLQPPADMLVSEDTLITLEKVLHNNGPEGPVTVTVNKTAVAPQDCTIDPLEHSFQVELPMSVDVTILEDYLIHCSSPSYHTFSVLNVVSGPKEPHVLDPDLTNNTAYTELTVAALTDVQKDILDIDMGPDPLLVEPSTVNLLQVTDTDESSADVNILKTATLTAAGPVVCDVIPAQQQVAMFEPAGISYETLDWDIHMNLADHLGEETWCELTYTVEKSCTDPHTYCYDYAEATLMVCGDTDGDTVADNGCGDLDNCVEDPNPGQEDSDGDGSGDVCDPDPELEVKMCLKFGPAPVNLSDSAGAYMWVICEIGNLETEPIVATISFATGIDLDGDTDVDIPEVVGCSQVDQLVLPGQESFTLAAEEQKWVLYRKAIQCHDPALEDIYEMVVTFCAEPGPFSNDDDGDTLVDEDSRDGTDDDGDSIDGEDPPNSNEPVCHEQKKLLIVHQP